ncbi:MAG: nickel-dependent hydrogenase large subunit [Candidatus Odinarchaeota archaeon]
MLKIVNVCTRVEGHGEVKIMLQNDEVSSANFDFPVYRGFEKFLIGKKLLDIPKFVSRICGLCYASQAIASCKTLENIYNIEISEQSINLRRLLMAAELIKSHSMNFFFQTMPDLLKIFKITQKTLSPYELIKFNPQLTSNLYDLIKFGSEINELFGGRSVHLISIIPGGVIYSPSRKLISLSQKYFQKSLTIIEWIIEEFIHLFADKTPPREFNLPDFICLAQNNHGIYDRYSGSLRLKEEDKNLIEFEAQNFSTYFSKEINLRGIDFYFENKKNVMVGPFSRYNLVENYEFDQIDTYIEYFKKSWKKNLLFINFLRLLEIYIESYKSIQILEDPSLNVKKNLPSLDAIKKNEGIGVIEAPRGTLIHNYHLNKNSNIDGIKLFIATEFNIPLLNQMITKYAQELFDKTGDIKLVEKEIQMIIRAFDPCISCATH